MDYVELAYELTTGLVGPGAVVPWWAWLAVLVMIFGGLLGPVLTGGDGSGPPDTGR